MVNSKIAGLMLTVALLETLGVATAADLTLEPGQYDFSIAYEIQGQKPKGPPMVERCIAEDDLHNPEKVFNDRELTGFKPDPSCVVKNLVIAGGGISYDAACSNRLAHVEGTESSTAFRVVRYVRPKGRRGVSFKLELTGQRTGGCARKEK